MAPSSCSLPELGHGLTQAIEPHRPGRPVRNAGESGRAVIMAAYGETPGSDPRGIGRRRDEPDEPLLRGVRHEPTALVQPSQGIAERPGR